MVTMSARKDREQPCQNLKTMFCHLQVCMCHLANIEPVFTVIFEFCVSVCVYIINKGNDGQKRQRLELAGRENRSPKPSSSRPITELQTKPDTPMVPSVRSRVQLLTQKQDGNQLFFH